MTIKTKRKMSARVVFVDEHYPNLSVVWPMGGRTLTLAHNGSGDELPVRLTAKRITKRGPIGWETAEEEAAKMFAAIPMDEAQSA